MFDARWSSKSDPHLHHTATQINSDHFPTCHTTRHDDFFFFLDNPEREEQGVLKTKPNDFKYATFKTGPPSSLEMDQVEGIESRSQSRAPAVWSADHHQQSQCANVRHDPGGEGKCFPSLARRFFFFNAPLWTNRLECEDGGGFSFLFHVSNKADDQFIKWHFSSYFC